MNPSCQQEVIAYRDTLVDSMVYCHAIIVFLITTLFARHIARFLDRFSQTIRTFSLYSNVIKEHRFLTR